MDLCAWFKRKYGYTYIENKEVRDILRLPTQRQDAEAQGMCEGWVWFMRRICETKC
jgi:hypothetical protein